MHGLDINLTMKLAKTFESISLESAKTQGGGEMVRMLERAGIYFNTSLVSIERKGGCEKEPPVRLFQAAGSALEQGEMEKMKEAALLFLNCQKMHMGDSRKVESRSSPEGLNLKFFKLPCVLDSTTSHLPRTVGNLGERVEITMESNYHNMLINELWEDVKDADCILIAESGEEIKVHSAILGSVWPGFDKLRDSLCSSCDTLRINLPSSSSSIIQFVSLLYTGSSLVLNLKQMELIQNLLSYLQLHWDCSSTGLSVHDENDKVRQFEDELREETMDNVDDKDYTFANSSSDYSESEEIDENCGEEVDKIEEDLVKERLFKCSYTLPPIKYGTYSKSNKSLEASSNGKVSLCSLNCTSNCEEKVSYWTIKEKEEIKDTFRGLSAVNKQQKLLKQLEFQDNAGLSTEGFYFKKQLLCVKQMSCLTSVSPYLLKKVKTNYQRGQKRYVHGNSSKKNCQVASINFCAWMKVYSERFGQDGPTDIVTVLPSYMNVAELFKLYTKEALTPLVKKSTFYKLLKSEFGPKRLNKNLPWIRISKVSTHSRCDVCVALDQYIRKSKNEAELEYGRSLKLEHTETYSRARIAVNEYIQRSISFPKEVVSMQIDSMDNSKSLIPRVLEKSKQLAGMFRLPCKVTGTITTSALYPQNQKLKFYIQHGTVILFFINNSV